MWEAQRDEDLETFLKQVHVGRLVIAARQASGESQYMFATGACLPQSLLSRYERGRKLPTIRTLIRIAAQAGVTLAITLAGESLEFDGEYYVDRKRALRGAKQLEKRIVRDRERYGKPLGLRARSREEHSVSPPLEQTHRGNSEHGDQHYIAD